MLIKISSHYYSRIYLVNDTSLQRQRSKRSLQAAATKKKAKRKRKPREDSEHPGPIFLASVVNRRFKYRYLIFGVVAFAVMGIIVGLSVYYSNKG